MNTRTILLGVAWCLLTSVGQAEINSHQVEGRLGPEHRDRPNVSLAGHHRETMIVDRDLQNYSDMFGDEFAHDLARLGGSDHWLDGGSGQSLAIQQYRRGMSPALRNRQQVKITGSRARVTGVTVEYNGQVPREQGLRILTGGYLEDASNENLTGPEYGRPKLITDLFGAWAYSNRPDAVLRKYLDILAPGGKIYLYGQDNNNKVMTKDGENISLLEWLSTRVRGINVRVVRTTNSGQYSVQIERTAQAVNVPALGEIRRNPERCPPWRYFEERD